jgi:hypothetical protein
VNRKVSVMLKVMLDHRFKIKWVNYWLFGFSCGARRSWFGFGPLGGFRDHVSETTHGLVPHVSVSRQPSPPVRLEGAL